MTNQYAWHKVTKIDNHMSNFHPIWNIIGRPLHASSPIPDILGYLAVDIVCGLKTSRPRLSVNLWRSPSIPSVTSGRSLPAYLESASTNTVRPSLPARSRCFFCNTAVFLGQQSTPNLTKRWISIFGFFYWSWVPSLSTLVTNSLHWLTHYGTDSRKLNGCSFGFCPNYLPSDYK